MSQQSSRDRKIPATKRAPAQKRAEPEAPPPPAGLRERKKQATRLAISDVATRLFIERGFDRVTVAEVAEAAGVSVNTIFNYFATKEELFFDRGEEVGGEPARMVRARRPGEPVLAALERGLREKGAMSVYEGARVLPFLATIEASPALKARERALFDRSEELLADALREAVGARGDDPAPQIIAALITALEWTIIREHRARLLRGEPDKKIRAALGRIAKRGFALLRDGVGSFGA